VRPYFSAWYSYKCCQLCFRRVIATVNRSGGLIGNVKLKYSVFYLPPGTDDVKNALPGILSNSEGIFAFEQDESKTSFPQIIDFSCPTYIAKHLKQ